MTTTQQGILCLIKSAVTGQCDPLPEKMNFRQVVALMLTHGMGAMCYPAVLNYNLHFNGNGIPYLEDQYCMTAVASQNQMEQIDRICDAFEKNGIAYMPVKGCIMKSMYPDHAMRTMCDADILIHEEEYEKIRPVMEELEFRETGESNHEHIWQNQYLTVELHKRLMPSYNKDYYSYFGEGWDLAKVHVGGYRWAMTNEDAFIYDTIHFAKHYRDANVNARFVVDLWVHLLSHPDLDQVYIRKQMARMRMESFYDNILHVIDAWFQNGSWDDKVEKITDFLFSLDLQEKKDKIMVAQNARAAQETGSTSKAKKSILLHKVFPGKEQMGFSYPRWKKIPLPIAWVMRWFYLLFRRRDAVLQEKARMGRITEADMESYRQDLEYIGLEFSDQVVLPD